MTHILLTVVEIVLTVMGVFAIGWFYGRGLKRSTDPAFQVFKTVLSFALIGGTVLFIRSMTGKLHGGFVGDAAPAAMITGSVAVCGILLSILWTPQISEWLMRPLTSLFDGGVEELEPKPLYSIARAKRKAGKFTEAIAALRAQLANFPNDFEGQMLVAEIQAEDQNDLQGAEITIHRLCGQQGHAAGELVFALNSLADWHLKYAQDPEAARQNLEKIAVLFPDSEFALAARQRLSRLSDSQRVLLQRHDHRKIIVAKGIQDMGLLAPDQQMTLPEISPELAAADYVKHLEAHPLDMDAREKLAMIYAAHYQRLDLATDQLEQMIQTPGQPPKSIVRWLNLLADFQIKLSGNYDNARQTLERIIKMSPDRSAANQARSRIAHLKLELKGQSENSQTVRLGSYEQDIGLKNPGPNL